MASTNKTSNLQLSQFIATDTPTWLVDYNGDMEKIDAGVARVEELAETASTQAVGAANGLQTTNQNVTTLSGQVANVQNQANTTTTSVNGINQRLGNADISGIGDGTITGAIISMQNNNLNFQYSTDEIDTGKKWIDGKTVYRKCYTGNSFNANTRKVLDTTINSSNVDTVIDISGSYKRADNGNIRPLYTASESSNDGMTITIGPENVYLYGYNVNTSKYTVVIEYTKI